MGCVGFTDFVDFVDFVGIIPDLAFFDFHSASSHGSLSIEAPIA